MSERLAFVTACLNRRERIVTICERFGISEKTGHKLLARVKAEGLEGLRERSHAPHTSRQRMAPDVAARIIALRRQYPLYGPAKLRDWLVQHEPAVHWPAASSMGELLTRAGLIRPRRRHARPSAGAAIAAGGRTAALAPNDVWTADFKGEFRLTSGGYCYPLTVLDLHSHYLLECRALTSTAVSPARASFVRLFREHGLPRVLRTDNGIPFAQPNALGRFGSLAFWWVRLGIRPEHITPARPAENGAHERFHKTLKAAAIRPPAPNLHAQQRRFDRFRLEYNTERPHESLPAHHPPGDCYRPAPRPYPTRLPPLIYPPDATVRLVDCSGYIRCQQQHLFLSSNLAGEYVGLLPTPTDVVTIAYASLALGTFDPQTNRFWPELHWLDDST